MQLKIFGKNAVIYAIGNIVLRSAAFLLIPLYTYHLSVRDYGLLASFFVTIEFLLILMGLGMRTTLERFCKEYEAKNLLKHLLGSTIFINIIGGLIVSFICLVFLLPFFSTALKVENIRLYITFVCVASLVQSLFLHMISYYRAQNEAMKFMLFSVFAALLLIIINFLLLVKFKYRIEGALLAQIIAYGITLVLISANTISKTGIAISPRLIKDLFRFGFPLVFSMSGQNIVWTASIYILSFFAGLEVVAIYALGNKLAKLLSIILILPFQMAFQPFVFANLNRPEIKNAITKLLTYFIFAIVLTSFMILIGTKIIIPIIAPPEYASAYLVVLLLLPVIAINGISVFGETLLNIVRKTHIIGFVYGLCGVSSVLLNYMFIPHLSWYGVVLTLYITFTTMSTVILIIGIKEYPIEIEWRRIIVALCFYIVYLSSIFLLKSTKDIIFYSITSLIIFISLVILYVGNMLDDREQKFLKKVLLNLQHSSSR